MALKCPLIGQIKKIPGNPQQSGPLSSQESIYSLSYGSWILKSFVAARLANHIVQTGPYKRHMHSHIRRGIRLASAF